MGERGPRTDRCALCGRPLNPATNQCPACGPLSRDPQAAASRGQEGRPPLPRRLRPPSRPRPEPLPAAWGQEPYGTWASVRSIFRDDPLLAAVLVLLGLAVLATATVGHLVGASIALAGLWGVLSFRGWGHWLAMLIFGSGALAFLVHIADALLWGDGPFVDQVVALVVSVFCLLVLWRREQFD